jgi:hypothetical protein
VLGFLAYVSLSVLVFECWVSGGRWWVASYLVSALLYLLLCILLLSFYLPFSRFLSLLRSPLSLLCSPLSLLVPILSRFRFFSLSGFRCGRGDDGPLDL